MPLLLQKTTPAALWGGLLLAIWALPAWGAEPEKAPAEAEKAKPDPYAWKSLFDGQTLQGWKAPEFGGQGEVTVEEGAIVLGLGEGITGVTYTGEVPKTNYEFSFEGRRLDGNDFFSSPTFPVGESHCSFIAGGWAGTVVGLSSIDFFDASDNLTTTFKQFKTGQWYRYRVRVTDSKIEAWIDDEKLITLVRKGHKFSTRFEIDPCKPLGIASWCTKGAVRNLRLRELKPEEVQASAAESEKK